MADQSSDEQSIEELQRRWEKLHKEQITAAANHNNARKLLEELQEESRRLHGTDDLDQLRAKLAEMEQANQRKRAQYQAHLDKIEADLREVERKFAVPAGVR